MEIKTLSDKKIEQEKDLAVRPVFPFYSRSKNLLAHVEKMRGVLLSQLPRPFPFSDKKSLAAWIEKTIPWITWSAFESPPDTVTLFFLIPPLSSLPTETFISEMIKRWLLPHQETKMLSFEHMEFFFELHPRESFFIAEASVLIKDRQEATLLKENLPLLKKEILSALSGRKFAPALLETKILPLDHKMNLIREGFIKLVSKFPDDLDETLFERLAFMQAYASKEFREERSYRHLARIILTFILLRSHLKRELNAFPEKRHMKIRFMPTILTFPFGTKPVLGLSIGLNFFHQYELFNEKHVVRAVQELYPYMRIVPGSTFRSNPLNGPVTMLYVEIEKEDGSQISLEERKTLRESLEEELKKRIEHLVPALFVVRNEEETMRNILMLSRELKSRDDLPQMMISFDQHSKDDLVFTVVLLRVKKEGMPSIQELLKNKDQRIRFILDRVQNVNFIDQSHPIEANVFRLQMAKLHSFLRMDFSVNLYVARDEIVKFLTEHIGEIRDYNGGMMIKQGEILTQFKRLFSDISSRNQEILENFFYSLNPIESQATISLQYLSLFFELFVKMTEKHQTDEKAYEIEHEKDDDITVMILRSTDPDYRPIVEEAIAKAAIRDRAVISSMLTIENSHYFSLLYEDTESAHHDLFRSSVEQALERWQEKKNQLQVLRIPYIDILSLDPRVGGDKESAVFVRLLFDGLMRIGKEGKPECAVAKTYELSEDHKTYTFHLRESYWSNGDPVTAYDFEYAWKQVLSPSFETPFAYVFYPIKNGRRAKEGDVALDQVGIKSINDHTLVVELEHPAPYFIELTANTLYMPVNRLVDKVHPNWATQRGESFVCNGPFKWKTTSESATFLELQKNPKYWNQDRIKIDQIHATQMNLATAVQMFNNGKLDVICSGLCPSGEQGVKTLPQGERGYYDSTSLSWLCFNVHQFPFNHLKIRQAFSMAIERKEIFSWHVAANEAAYTPLPLRLTQCSESPFLLLEDKTRAKALFLEALEEIKMKIEDFPIIYYLTAKAVKESALIIKKQWEDTLGIKCVIEESNWTDHFKKLTTRNYQTGSVHWFSWFNDPLYTLQSFRYSKEKVNFTGWENEMFQHLLNQSDQTLDQEKRMAFLRDAEELVIKDAIVLPVCYGRSWYEIKPHVILNQTFMSTHIDLSYLSLKRG